MRWNIEEVEKNLKIAFEKNSERHLLNTLKDNSFLFYGLYSRKFGIQPIFREISFGGELRCDYAWLNDNSDGPEWVLVEIEKPKMKLFTKNNKPSSELNAAIEQVKTWDKYFDENPNEKNRIFGIVAKFRYILIAGSRKDWSSNYAKKWRIYHNKKSDIEIRSTDVFFDALEHLKKHEEEFWSFKEHPKTKTQSELKTYLDNLSYLNYFRKI
ncbi:Shedu anti-phage system protein SduA domain-containing protein [Nautilia sp.]